MTFGPFAVNPASIEGLGGANFTPFVNRLLASEAAAHGLAGAALETTYRDNVGDGGVDAQIHSAVSTRWLPIGDSAWQFKAGDLTPAKCKTELAGASWAVEVLRAGGKYRLVLGRSITAQMIERRRSALKEQATGLGIVVDDDSIDVIAADSLAQWSEEFPALAVSPLLRSAGSAGQTFDEWSSSTTHQTTWASSDGRDREIAAIRSFVVGSGSAPDLHIEGYSGTGKSRLVLEALRDQDFQSLVLYVPDADSFQVPTLIDLQRQARSAVVVVDECEARAHNVFAGVLAAGTPLRLITIGEPSDRSTKSPMLDVVGLESESMTALLKVNQPGLWPEAIRVVVEVAAGNVDYALKASRAVVEREATRAKELVTASDVRSFLASDLPDGALFLGCCALALFSRLGFDGEVAGELARVAHGLGLDERDIRAAAATLEQRGLLSRQGRFRSVSPHPVALYLADRGWSEFGESIVRDLLPALDSDVAERLFRRATELGDPEPVTAAVRYLLRADGPLASWEGLRGDENGRLLTHVAVLAPEQTLELVGTLIDETADGDLLALEGARRTLVWTLEKLVWHSATFTASARLLLRLALNENESFSNNASGTWVDLFGTMLPGTAAPPQDRIACLVAAARSADVRVRALAVRASRRALDTHESITVSGEVQGGALVAPRGTPATYGDAWAYRNEVIDVLRSLVDDPDRQIAAEALKTLIGCIHGSLEIDSNRGHLAEVFSTLDAVSLRAVRAELANLQALFGRADVTDRRVPGADELVAMIPPASELDQLWELAHTNSWDREDGVLIRELREAADRLGDGGAQALIDVLADEPPPSAAFEMGRVLAGLARGTKQYLSHLPVGQEGGRGEATVGYLWAMVDAGITNAFDEFIDGLDVDPLTLLSLTVRGPVTDRARARVEAIVPQLSVAESAGRLFRWFRDVEQADVAVQLNGWLERLATQADYNAVVDLVALYLHGKELADPVLSAGVGALVAARRQFPEVRRQGFDWATLARHQMLSQPGALAELFVGLIEGDALSTYEGSDELKLLKSAVRAADFEVWESIMNKVADGSWRVGLATRGWVSDAADVDDARRWVGADAGRARALASGAGVGGAELSDVVRYLLREFDGDQDVAGALVGNLISGFWSGPESDRIKGQIETVEGWIRRPGEATPVVKWARRLRDHLADRLIAVEQREAEGY